MTCYQNFPKMFGADDGNSVFTYVDYNPGTAELITCGLSYASPSLVNAAPSPVPILIKYETLYGEIIYAKQYDTQGSVSGVSITHLHKCRFSEDGTYVVGTFLNEMAIGIFLASDGSIVRTYYVEDMFATRFTTQEIATLEMDVSENIYGVLFDSMQFTFWIFKFPGSLSASTAVSIPATYSSAFVTGVLIYGDAFGVDFASQHLLVPYCDPANIGIGKVSFTDGSMTYYIQMNFQSPSPLQNIAALSTQVLPDTNLGTFICMSKLGTSQADLGFYFLKETSPLNTGVTNSWYYTNTHGDGDCVGSVMSPTSTSSKMIAQVLIQFTDYTGHSDYDKLLLLTFDSSQYVTSYTGMVIHYSNHVSDFRYAEFSGIGVFTVVGKTQALNSVSFTTERALMMMYPEVQFCGVTETTQTLTMTLNNLVTQSVTPGVTGFADMFTVFPSLTDDTNVADVLIANLATQVCAYPIDPIVVTPMSDFNYTIRSGTILLDMTSLFTTAMCTNPTFSFTSVTLLDLSPLPTFMTLKTFNTKIQIASNAESDIGNYQIYVESLLIGNGQTSSATFNINVLNYTNTAPYFTIDEQQVILNNVTLFAGDGLDYRLPSYKDDQGDPVAITLRLMRDSKILNLPSFITFKARDVKINPQHNHQAGEYIIRVTLSDQIVSTVYYFYVLVLPNPKLVPVINKDPDTNQTLNNGSTVDPELIDKDLTAKIASISLDGLVTVKFSKPIFTPFNYSTYNDTHLDIRFTESDGTHMNLEVYKDYNWTISYIYRDIMNIRMNFLDTHYISMYNDKDWIKISFLQNARFVASQTAKCISYQYTVRAIMPPQLDYEDDDVYQWTQASKLAKELLQYYMAGHIVLNIFLQSLTFLTHQVNCFGKAMGHHQYFAAFLPYPITQHQHPSQCDPSLQYHCQCSEFRLHLAQ